MTTQKRNAGTSLGIARKSAATKIFNSQTIVESRVVALPLKNGDPTDHSAGKVQIEEIECNGLSLKQFVKEICSRRSSSPKIVISSSHDYLCLAFPLPNTTDQAVNVTFLLKLPNLLEPLLMATQRAMLDQAQAFRHVIALNLKCGLCAFLSAHHPQASLLDLDDELFQRYILWQSSPSASSSQVKPPGLQTCRSRVDAGRRILRALQLFPAWHEVAKRILSAYPPNPYKNAESFSKPRDVIDQAVLKRIRQAALMEIEEIKLRFDTGDRLLEEGRKKHDSGLKDYSDFSMALAAFSDIYRNQPPQLADIKKENWELYAATVGRGCVPAGKGHGILSYSRYLHAYSQDMVPFVLLLAMEGAFNPDTVLGLNRSDIRRRSLFGVETVSIEARKGRAAGGIYGKDLSPDIVDPWLKLLERITHRLRQSVDASLRDRLFIFAVTKSKPPAKSYNYITGIPSSDICWFRTLAAFRERHNLPHFTLSQIRTTLIDLVGQRHNSLIASKAARHVHFNTTEGHYIGSGTVLRERERLGEATQQLSRWTQSNGRIDVRRSVRPGNHDKGSATPGFKCLDPYSSPMPGQKPQQLCRAFGCCPTCPMALFNFKDPLSAAFWIALEKSIFQAKDELDPQTWNSRWAPVATRLQAMIETTPIEVLEAAKKFRVRLPQVS